MIDKAYITALRIPFLLLPLLLVKKLTVIGIIGNTQGVSRAKKPPSIPAIKIPRILESIPSSSDSVPPHPGSNLVNGSSEIDAFSVSAGITTSAFPVS